MTDNPRTLITGFEPFDDRPLNASWVAAESLQSEPHVSVMQLPVAWGAPLTYLSPACKDLTPQMVLSLGEGREGWFDIETRALNRRDKRADNLGVIETAPIDVSGPDVRYSSAPASTVQRLMWQQGWPMRVSSDAGQYLCEETLYNLESLKALHTSIKIASFIHVPPFGTPVWFKGRQQPCDCNLLSVFVKELYLAFQGCV